MTTDCMNNGAEESYIEVPILHYTGYRAFAESSGEELQTVKGTNNIVRILLPGGFTDQIELKFVSPIHWRISEAVTYIWWLFVGIFLIRRRQGCNEK